MFQLNFVKKTTENDHFETIVQLFPVPPPHFSDNWIIVLILHRFLIYKTCIRKKLAGFDLF